MLECPYCGKEMVDRRKIGGHIAGHTKRGDVPLSKEVRYRKRGEEVIDPSKVLNPGDVAASLLGLVVDRINLETNHGNQVKALNEQILDLEYRLKKAVEEKERAVRAHNETVKQMGGGKLPSMRSIVDALERDPVITGKRK